MRLRPYLPALLGLVLVTLVLAGCGSGGRRPMESVSRGWKETGRASWYGEKFHGRMTANGEIYDMYGMTAAHKRLPFDTLVEVENLDNGRRVQVRINDRGPFIRGRIIDLTHTAADRIDMIGTGTAKVRIKVVGAAEMAGRRWVVQAGAFSERDTARALERELERSFSSVRVESESGIHRVLVGRFKKKDKADDVARKLRRNGYDALVRGDSG